MNTLAAPPAGIVEEKRSALKGLCAAQGLYYLTTGVWPWLSMRSFEAVTGPKTDNWTGRESDHWLVKTVGVAVAAIGASLLVAAKRGEEKDKAVSTLAISSALGLTAIDLIYTARGVIAPVYLLDAVAELGLVGGWLTATKKHDERHGPLPMGVEDLHPQ